MCQGIAIISDKVLHSYKLFGHRGKQEELGTAEDLTDNSAESLSTEDTRPIWYGYQELM